MTASNLATVFGPTILRAREESLSNAGNNDLINPLTESLILDVETIFGSAQRLSSPMQVSTPTPPQSKPPSHLGPPQIPQMTPTGQIPQPNPSSGQIPTGPSSGQIPQGPNPPKKLPPGAIPMGMPGLGELQTKLKTRSTISGGSPVIEKKLPTPTQPPTQPTQPTSTQPMPQRPPPRGPSPNPPSTTPTLPPPRTTSLAPPTKQTRKPSISDPEVERPVSPIPTDVPTPSTPPLVRHEQPETTQKPRPTDLEGKMTYLEELQTNNVNLLERIKKHLGK